MMNFMVQAKGTVNHFILQREMIRLSIVVIFSLIREVTHLAVIAFREVA